MKIAYDRHKRFIWNNWVGVDTSGKYYIETDNGDGTFTISAKNNEFDSFIHENATTIYVAGTTGTAGGTGTMADPVQTFLQANALLDAAHYQICIIESGVYEGCDIDAASLPAEDFRIFTKAGILAGMYPESGKNYILRTYNLGSAVNKLILNIWFNSFGLNYVSIPILINTHTYRHNFLICFCNGTEGNSTIDLSYSNPSKCLFFGIGGDQNSIKNCYVYTSGTYIYSGQYFYYAITIPDYIKNNIFITNSDYIEWYGQGTGSNGYIEENIFMNISFKQLIDGYPSESDVNIGALYFNKNIFINGTKLSDTQLSGLSSMIYNCSNLYQYEQASGNIKANPGFVKNSPIKPEDFQLRTKQLDYINNSPCFLTGNADEDENIGTWQGIPEPAYSYKIFEISVLPAQILIPLINMDYKSYGGGRKGNIETVKSGSKRAVIISYPDNRYTQEEDICFLDYVSSRTMFEESDPLNILQPDIMAKFFEDINTGKAFGNIGSIDTIENIIAASTINYYAGERGLVNSNSFMHDQFCGYKLWAIWAEFSNKTIADKTITGLTGLTVDRYKGYWACVWTNTKDKMFYYIKENSETEIILEDFYNNLENDIYNILIFKEFLIIKMIDNQIYLDNEKNETLNGIQKYIIQNIDIVSTNSAMNYQILGYVRHNSPGYPRNGITRTFQQV